MLKDIKFLITSVSVLIILGFLLFIINQIHNLYDLASGVSPFAGQITLWGLIIAFSILFSIPFVIFFRLPKNIAFPSDEKDLPAYRNKILKKVSSNKYLKANQITIKSDGDLENGIKILDAEADRIIHKTASTVFITTAISQNGKLDAFTVLATQTKMVWDIAHLYYQRPSLKDMTRLYANIGATTFLASEIENLNISEQIEPIIKSMIKNSTGKAIPVFGPSANIILDAMLEGSTNAFLTLRVGIVAKKYCGNTGMMDKKAIKRSAFMEASNQLGKLVLDSSARVISSIVKATKKAGADTVKSSYEAVKKAGISVKDSVADTAGRINPFKKKQEPI